MTTKPRTPILDERLSGLALELVTAGVPLMRRPELMKRTGDSEVDAIRKQAALLDLHVAVLRALPELAADINVDRHLRTLAEFAVSPTRPAPFAVGRALVGTFGNHGARAVRRAFDGRDPEYRIIVERVEGVTSRRSKRSKRFLPPLGQVPLKDDEFHFEVFKRYLQLKSEGRARPVEDALVEVAAEHRRTKAIGTMRNAFHAWTRERKALGYIDAEDVVRTLRNPKHRPAYSVRQIPHRGRPQGKPKNP